jgi:DNA-binding transcriptional MerR regulator
MKKRLFTVKDVLREAGISRNTLFNWEHKNRVPKAKRNIYGHRVYWPNDVASIVHYARKVFIPIE